MPYSSKAANYILYTPLDTKAIVENDIAYKLDRDFFSCCYIEPQYKTNFSSRITDSNYEPYDYVVKSEHLADLKTRQKTDFENFRKWLSNESNYKVYTISGNAGTGKTTFINKLKIDNPNEVWTILDIIKSNDTIEWFEGIETEIKDFATPYSKMLAITLNQISEILFKEADTEDKTKAPDYNAIKKNLKRIIRYYDKHLQNRKHRGSELLAQLLHILKFSFNSRVALTKCADCVKFYFEEAFKNINITSAHPQKIMFRTSLDVLILLLYCSAPNQKHIIIYDNLERFISHDEIYNKDLEEIRKELASYSQNLYRSKKVFNNKFKIIMGIRTSSARMCGVKLDAAEENPSDLNLTDWYLAEKIIDKKYKWYVKNGYAKYLPGTKLLTRIISDLRMCFGEELTGLQLFITPLFNDNIRLMVDFIGMMVEQKSNETLLKKYTELWEENTPVSRFAARTIIRGMIYQTLDANDNLFKNLLLQPIHCSGSTTVSTDIYGLSYARKILTVLYNHGEADVSLADVLSIISNIDEKFYDYWKNVVDIETKNDISKILFYMNSYNRRDNDWIQFVDMQINGITQSASISDEVQLCKIIDKNINSVFLKIMPAGQTYLRYIVCSFEYFSYRFYKKHVDNYSPLFTCIPSLAELQSVNNIKDLLCYKIIDYVSFNAVECIKNIQKIGDIHIQLTANNSKSHSERIVNHHKGYIDMFIYYIRKKYENVDKCEDLIKELKDLKSRYYIIN